MGIRRCCEVLPGVGSLVGAISLEVFGQYGADTLSAPGVVFDGQMRLLVQTLTSPAAGVWPHTGTN